RVWRFATCAGALRTLRPRAASTTRPSRWKATQLAVVRPAAKTTAAGAPCSIARRDRPRLRDAWALRFVRPERAPNPDRALRRAVREKGRSARSGDDSLLQGIEGRHGFPGAPRTCGGVGAMSRPPRSTSQFVRGETAAQRDLGGHARVHELPEVVRSARLPADTRELPSAEGLAADAGAGGGAVDVEVADAKRLPRSM